MANPQWMYFSRAMYSSLPEKNGIIVYHCPLVQHKFCINRKYIFDVNHRPNTRVEDAQTDYR